MTFDEKHPSSDKEHPGNKFYHDVYDRAELCAANTVSSLEAAWEWPVRHNLKIERAALWWAHLTVMRIYDVDEELWSPYPQDVDAATRYDFQASLSTIPTLLPHKGQDLHRKLLGPRYQIEREHEFRGDFTEHAYQRAPAVFDEWHKWLWTSSTGEGRTHAEPSPDALVLAEGCTRLAVSLNTIIGTYKQPQSQ